MFLLAVSVWMHICPGVGHGTGAPSVNGCSVCPFSLLFMCTFRGDDLSKTYWWRNYVVERMRLHGQVYELPQVRVRCQ